MGGLSSFGTPIRGNSRNIAENHVPLNSKNEYCAHWAVLLVAGRCVFMRVGAVVAIIGF